MAYKIRIESFEGPFDLLLYLVSRRKVDIGAISIADITDQYLVEISRMQDLDLDVASDFLLVAATLLEIKAASLLPQEKSSLAEEFQEISPHEARDILIYRLLEYKKYKNAAAAMNARFVAEGRMHARPFGPDRPFLAVMPDYLEGVSLDALAFICAEAYARREVFLLEAEHIAAKPIPIETHVRAIHQKIMNMKQVKFSDLVNKQAPAPLFIVTFLAVLELYKRSMVNIVQEKAFGDIEINYIEGSGELGFEGENAVSALTFHEGEYHDPAKLRKE